MSIETLKATAPLVALIVAIISIGFGGVACCLISIGRQKHRSKLDSAFFYSGAAILGAHTCLGCAFTVTLIKDWLKYL